MSLGPLSLPSAPIGVRVLVADAALLPRRGWMFDPTQHIPTVLCTRERFDELRALFPAPSSDAR